MKKKKYKLIKKSVTASILCLLASSTVLLPKIEASAEKIEYSETEEAQIKDFKEVLASLETTTNISFHNQELFDIVSSCIDGELTAGNIKNIKSLEINHELSNNDFSDLKFLTDLRFLTIKNNTIDLSDLEYNTSLCGLNLDGCKVSNTTSLPNSIETIFLSYVKVIDYDFSVPYNLKSLNLLYSPISSLNFKNKESITSLSILGSVYFSVKDIMDCPNLRTLNLLYCTQINDPEYLPQLKSVYNLMIDEYASIWLDLDTLEKLPISKSKKEKISTYIIELDELAASLVSSSLTDDEKIRCISSYILNNYSYDGRVKDDAEKDLSRNYNLHPISSALEGNKIICINYSTFFQSLANRADIEALTLVNKNHAWNAVNLDGEYKGIDLTNLDTIENAGELVLLGDSLSNFYFEAPTEYSSVEKGIYPQAPTITEYKLGYIDQNPEFEIEKLVYNGLVFRLKCKLNREDMIFLGFYGTMLGAQLVLINHPDKKVKTKKRKVKRKTLENN